MEKAKIDVNIQGAGAHEVFDGKGQSEIIKKMYAESAPYFSHIIRNLLRPTSDQYEVLDVGSFKGELIGAIKKELGEEYNFHVTGVDTNEAIIENQNVDEPIRVDFVESPFKEKKFDLTICRYVLQWNDMEKQKSILQELVRVTKGYVILQHAGADRMETEKWQEKMHTALFGAIPKLARKDGYFSSPDEIESWMSDLNIEYKVLQDRVLEPVSSLLTEKYCLDDSEASQVIKILDDKDTVNQTTWILKGQAEEI